MNESMKVLAAAHCGPRGIQMVDRRGQVMAHRRITARGMWNETAGLLAEGPVEVPATAHYRAMIAAGDLVACEVVASRRSK